MHPAARPLNSGVRRQTKMAKFTALFLLILLPATFGLCYVLYKYVLPVPGAVALAVAGVFVAALLGFYFGKRHARLGVSAATWSTALFALTFAVFYIATANPDEKYSILTGLGYFAIPFACLVASLYGESRGAPALLRQQGSA